MFFFETEFSLNGIFTMKTWWLNKIWNVRLWHVIPWMIETQQIYKELWIVKIVITFITFENIFLFFNVFQCFSFVKIQVKNENPVNINVVIHTLNSTVQCWTRVFWLKFHQLLILWNWIQYNTIQYNTIEIRNTFLTNENGMKKWH